MNEFDKLFNEHFGENNNNPYERIIKLMQQLNAGGGFGGINPEETNLGEPDEIVEFEQDGVRLVKSTWNTPYGQIVRIVTKEDIKFTNEFFNRNNIPTGRKKVNVELTLEEQLEIAKRTENYELCAELRDKIKARDEEKIAGENKNNKGIPKKDNKDETSENLDNKGFPEIDEWNF